MGCLKKGYTQVYTGNGKGKTTAALGLALRAAGNGMKVFMGQFVKGMEYSEIKSLKKFSEDITVVQLGRGCFIEKDPENEDVVYAQKGLAMLKEVIMGGQYDVVILDEVNIAIHFKLLTVDEVVQLIEQKPTNLELILTGRFAHQSILDKADLITEMQEVKHYYRQGVLARAGIER